MVILPPVILLACVCAPRPSGGVPHGPDGGPHGEARPGPFLGARASLRGGDVVGQLQPFLSASLPSRAIIVHIMVLCGVTWCYETCQDIVLSFPQCRSKSMEVVAQKHRLHEVFYLRWSEAGFRIRRQSPGRVPGDTCPRFRRPLRPTGGRWSSPSSPPVAPSRMCPPHSPPSPPRDVFALFFDSIYSPIFFGNPHL